MRKLVEGYIRKKEGCAEDRYRCFARPRFSHWTRVLAALGAIVVASVPAYADFDWDGKSDLVTWRPSNATW